MVLILSQQSREIYDLFDASSRDWHPLVLLPGGLAGKEFLKSALRVGPPLLVLPHTPHGHHARRSGGI